MWRPGDVAEGEDEGGGEGLDVGVDLDEDQDVDPGVGPGEEVGVEEEGDLAADNEGVYVETEQGEEEECSV